MCNGAENKVKHYICVSPRNGKELEAWRLSHHANGNNSQTQHRDVIEQVLTSARSAGDVCVCAQMKTELLNVWEYVRGKTSLHSVNPYHAGQRPPERK